MKNLLSCLVVTGIVCSPFAFAQDKKAEKPAAPAAPNAQEPGKKEMPAMQDDKAMEEAMEAAAKPGKYHAWLKGMEGTWTSSMKNMMDPTSKASAGVQKNEMALGGRFLRMSMDSTFMDKPFMGTGMIGYNNVEKQFEAVWVDTMGTGINMSKGQASADGKVLTMKGEMTMPDGSKTKYEEVTTIVGKDSYKFEWKMDMGGQMGTMMEITYTRSKDAGHGHDGHKHDDMKKDEKVGK
ncbi:MAG: DUF1579 domain-containing protein [Phycisphaerales bacterium]